MSVSDPGARTNWLSSRYCYQMKVWDSVSNMEGMRVGSYHHGRRALYFDRFHSLKQWDLRVNVAASAVKQNVVQLDNLSSGDLEEAIEGAYGVKQLRQLQSVGWNPFWHLFLVFMIVSSKWETWETYSICVDTSSKSIIGLKAIGILSSNKI
jgi:hypothetical protein